MIDDVTAVHWACHDCNDEALRILVGYGAELENQDYLGRAPIHWACAAKSIACLKVTHHTPHCAQYAVCVCLNNRIIKSKLFFTLLFFKISI